MRHATLSSVASLHLRKNPDSYLSILAYSSRHCQILNCILKHDILVELTYVGAALPPLTKSDRRC